MRFVDDTWLGELTLVDPDTREATRIDDRVIAGTPLATWKHPDDPDILLYGVVDGERSGVWLAAPCLQRLTRGSPRSPVTLPRAPATA
jgi:hypothetical protein